MTDETEIRRRFGAALELLNQKKPEDCAVELERIVADAPDFLDAYEGLAVLYNRLGRVDEAIALMDRLILKDPDSIMARVNLSVFYMKKGMKDEAEVQKAKATVLQFSQGKKR